MAEYDETGDLAVLLHAAMRQGSWSPAPRGAVERMRHELGIGDATMASDIEQALRRRETARRMAVRTMEHEIPVSLARAAQADIEAMGDDVPRALQRLWGYLLPAEVPDSQTA